MNSPSQRTFGSTSSSATGERGSSISIKENEPQNKMDLNQVIDAPKSQPVVAAASDPAVGPSLTPPCRSPSFSYRQDEGGKMFASD
jgi:hypothetical protein